MKNLKRAQRRHDKQTHFIKRLKNFKLTFMHNDEEISTLNIEDKKSLLEHYKWLNLYKSTGTLCSCSLCSGENYNRNKTKEEFKKEIEDWEKELSEFSDDEIEDLLNEVLP